MPTWGSSCPRPATGYGILTAIVSRFLGMCACGAGTIVIESVEQRMARNNVVERWLTLSHQELVDEVYQLVRRHDGHALGCWNEVRGHPVLAARVRGILSALERQSAEYRDAGMWRIWIDQARRLLPTSATTASGAVASASVPSASGSAAPGTQAEPVTSVPEMPGEDADQEADLVRVSNPPPAAAKVTFRAPGQ